MPRHRLHPVAALVVAAVALAGVLLVTAPRAHAGAPAPAPRVGIVVTVKVNVSDAEATLLAERLGDALAEKLVVDVLAGREVTRRLADMTLPEDCVAQKECIETVGKRLDADQLLFLVIVRVGSQFQIDPTWAEVASGRTLAREAIQLDDSDPLPERVFRPRAQKLLPDARLRQDGSATVVIGGGARKPEGRHMTTPAWIAGGVGAAALIGGTIFGLQAISSNGSLEDDGCASGPCDDAASRANELEDQILYADVLFGVALVAGATAAWFYWSSAEPAAPSDARRPPAPPPVGVTAVPGAGVLVHVGGQF